MGECKGSGTLAFNHNWVLMGKAFVTPDDSIEFRADLYICRDCDAIAAVNPKEKDD